MGFNADEPCTEVKRGKQFDLHLRDLEQPQSPSTVSLRWPWRWLWKQAYQNAYDIWMPEVTLILKIMGKSRMVTHLKRRYASTSRMASFTPSEPVGHLIFLSANCL